MSVESFIEKVVEASNDSEIRKEFHEGLQIQFTIDKDETNIIALLPKNNSEKDTL
jgi:hypothetical protein